MKASELMIGDWVLSRFTGTPGRVKIESFVCHDSWEDGNHGAFNFNDVEPFPLTEEMLKANGFVRVNSQRYDYGCPDTDCYVKINPKKNMIHVNGRNSNCNLYWHSFVHELQHALRLCGLNELADNFKLK